MTVVKIKWGVTCNTSSREPDVSPVLGTLLTITFLLEINPTYSDLFLSMELTFSRVPGQNFGVVFWFSPLIYLIEPTNHWVLEGLLHWPPFWLSPTGHSHSLLWFPSSSSHSSFIPVPHLCFKHKTFSVSWSLEKTSAVYCGLERDPQAPLSGTPMYSTSWHLCTRVCSFCIAHQLKT